MTDRAREIAAALACAAGHKARADRSEAALQEADTLIHRYVTCFVAPDHAEAYRAHEARRAALTPSPKEPPDADV